MLSNIAQDSAVNLEQAKMVNKSIGADTIVRNDSIMHSVGLSTDSKMIHHITST